MTQEQINPPFDASPPCPACQQEVRARASLLHNFLNRCAIAEGCGNAAQGKAWVKLWDLKRHHGAPVRLTVPHPAAQEIVDVTAALVAACAGLTEDGINIRWTPETAEKVNALVWRTAQAVDAWAPIADAHFHDDRHASMRMNTIRGAQGSSFSGHTPALKHRDTGYNHFVENVAEGGDLRHTVCGAIMKLAPVFIENMDRDPTFYGAVYCRACGGDMPFAQFERLASSSGL